MDYRKYALTFMQIHLTASATYTYVGSIPQVDRTFSYLEGTYGVLNEWNVGVAESTCGAQFGSQPPNAIMSIDVLSRLAMERAKTSREAVTIMGELAEEYGFYGPGSYERPTPNIPLI